MPPKARELHFLISVLTRNELRNDTSASDREEYNRRELGRKPGNKEGRMYPLKLNKEICIYNSISPCTSIKFHKLTQMPELQGHGHPVTQSYHRSSLLDTTKHVDLMFQKRFLSHPKRLTIVRHCQGQRGMFFLTKYQQQWKESKLNLSKNSFKKIRKDDTG